MKRLLSNPTLWVIVVFSLMAAPWVWRDITHADPEQSVTAEKTDKPAEPKSICPVTKFTDNARCMDCHVLVNRNGKIAWAVRETDPNDWYRYPHPNFRFVENGGQKEAFFVCKTIDDTDFFSMFEYLKRYPEVKKLTIELHTPGGSIMAMWRIVAMMDDWKASGRTIKCLSKGMTASAGFILLANATPGQRFVAPNAEIMWHEVQSLEVIFGYKVSTPSDKEDEARILRHFQDNGNNFLASKGKWSKTDIDEKIRKREWWMTGQEAMDLGFADGPIK